MISLLTVNQLAKHYIVDRTTIYRWIKEGMPFQTTPGGAKRFTLESIEIWLSEKKEGN